MIPILGRKSSTTSECAVNRPQAPKAFKGQHFLSQLMEKTTASPFARFNGGRHGEA
jgi:hypothetical protein